MDVTCNLKVRKKDVRDHLTEILPFRQGRRQVKICGVDRHGERGARVYNGGLGAEQPPYPCKNSSDLYQFQERPLAKVSTPVHLVATPLQAAQSSQGEDAGVLVNSAIYTVSAASAFLSSSQGERYISHLPTL